MSELKVRFRSGEHEFEVEGVADAVERQVEIFRNLIWPTSTDSAAEKATQAKPDTPAWEKLMRVNGRIISLKAVSNASDAVLAILLGQHHLRENHSVSGREIMEGLRSSGLNLWRADAILQRHAIKGHVVSTGRRRLRRYRLSTDGIHQAQHVAQTLAARLEAKPVE
jgi:hypothetical protein